MWPGVHYRLGGLCLIFGLTISKLFGINLFVELLSVSQADEYEKESWQLDENEKSIAIENLRQKGNQLYKEKNYGEAEISYRNALGMVEQLILKYVPVSVKLILSKVTII